ncbi:chloramphenicol resistance protein [Marinifilum breve]|uniref:Chloramphenicol resistance protein n=1 Tax=Marinifilum breve TaxID=2184082 RepID=A0A2V4AEM6_9BACT|nr:chondroitinase-B domain-containing protein [Marinifilum breve]PXY02544.1 chloramphenicol resistance protein [Marinifilum breve]
MIRLSYTLVIVFHLIFFSGLGEANASNQLVSTVQQLESKVRDLQAGDTLFIANGEYQNAQLILNNSGKAEQPIVIRAKQRGKVFFTGDAKVEMRGEYCVLDGIYFKDGNRNSKEWKSHGPGLVAIYASHNRVTQCAFHAFDQANSAYITTSLAEDGQVPQYCRIDHCAFTEKITFDQVINLNNVSSKDKKKKGIVGIPMYHRIDHCYFSNPRKPGNAGGGIRVGYWRSDYGRCLVDHNLFDRQDSEPEIITSKSMENVYYNNTYKNCYGTMNLRHGDRQVILNNFFIGTDTKREYGGVFVWGSDHIIANNYFNLPTTLKKRGQAALFLNCGAKADEHALAYDIRIVNNFFDKNNGFAINFSALLDRRIAYCKKKGVKLEFPHDLYIGGNLFVSNKTAKFPLFYKHDDSDRNILWKQNKAINADIGFAIADGLESISKKVKGEREDIYEKYISKELITNEALFYNVEGIDLDIPAIIAKGLTGKPLTFEQVGPAWLKEIPGTYAKTGKLSKEIQQKFDEVTQKRAK